MVDKHKLLFLGYSENLFVKEKLVYSHIVNNYKTEIVKC